LEPKSSVFLDRGDTRIVIPYVLTNSTPGNYTIEPRYYHHQYKQHLIRKKLKQEKGM
jgi:hypothetical protein